MSMYKRTGNYKGVDYIVLETDTIYNIQNEEQYKIIIDHLNSQIGYDYFKMDIVSYPYCLYVSAEEILDAEKSMLVGNKAI